MLAGHFYERMPWSKPEKPVYFLHSEEARMDLRHCMRDAGVIQSSVKKKKMTPGQQKQTKDLKRTDLNWYRIDATMHDSIMEDSFVENDVRLSIIFIYF